MIRITEHTKKKKKKKKFRFQIMSSESFTKRDQDKSSLKKGSRLHESADIHRMERDDGSRRKIQLIKLKLLGIIPDLRGGSR